MNILSLLSGIIKSVTTLFVDYIAVILPLLAGVYFTLRTRFVQVRCFREGICELFSKERKGDGISPLAALSAAVGSAVGVGNIVGASAAIIIGGAGAVFWMWVASFFGMATVYTEAKTAVLTRIKGESGYIGGANLYIGLAIGGRCGKFLSALFSVSAGLALGISGPMLQSSAVCGAFYEGYKIPTAMIGAFLALLTLAATSGGLKRIASISQKTVGVMSVLFMGALITVLVFNARYIPSALCWIFKNAFSPSALAGGTGGFLIAASEGVKKGVYSNEAGFGTASHLYAPSSCKSPHKAGCVAMLSVFADSFVILTATALVMLTFFIKYNVTDFTKLVSSGLLLHAMTPVFGRSAAIIFTLSLLFFGYSSIISWNYIGRVNCSLLFGKRAERPYLLISALAVLAGGFLSSSFLWDLSDFLNIFMILPNCVGLMMYKKGKIYG